MYKTEIFENYEAFVKRPDKNINGVDRNTALLFPDYLEDNETNKGCWNCYDCTECEGLIEVGAEEGLSPVVVENIHQKVYAAASKEGALDMGDWHLDGFCGTTHCRAGWANHLAGEQGKKLENALGPTIAALNIFKASSPEIPIDVLEFYDDSKTALASMKRCAELEAKLNAQKDV